MLFLFAALCIAACKSYSSEKLTWQGPIIEGERRADAFKSCDAGTTEARPCKILIVDRDGKELDTKKDVADVVDAFLPNVSALAAWAPVRQTLGASVPDFRGTFVPYRLHLLTISPIVILVNLLEKAEQQETCNGAKSDCIYSDALKMTLAVKDPPKIQLGSFWFSPDLKISHQLLPHGRIRHSICLGSSVLELLADGETWKVRRDFSGKTKCHKSDAE